MDPHTFFNIKCFNIIHYVASGNLHCTLIRKLERKRQSLKVIMKIVLTCGPQKRVLGVLGPHWEFLYSVLEVGGKTALPDLAIELEKPYLQINSYKREGGVSPNT